MQSTTNLVHRPESFFAFLDVYFEMNRPKNERPECFRDKEFFGEESF